MNDTAPRKRRRNGAATREKILAEALRLFAEKGYDATSIKEIATAVGVADAALYRHFPSKDDIALAVFSRHYEALARSISDIAQNVSTTNEIIDRLVTLLCNLFDREPQVFRFLLIHQHDHLRFVGAKENPVEEIATIMRRGIACGDISISDANLAAAMALGAAIQPAVFILYGRLAGPLSAHRRNISAAVRRALGMASSG